MRTIIQAPSSFTEEELRELITILHMELIKIIKNHQPELSEYSYERKARIQTITLKLRKQLRKYNRL